MTKLKPCIIFDIDETLVKTPKSSNAGDVKVARLIDPMVFIYNAVDEMINSPPQRVVDEKLDANWPKDIFFLTARCETLREATITSLMKVTGDSYTAISKRLLMRPKRMDNPRVDTAYAVKRHLAEQLAAKGFYGAIVFDDNHDALQAFRDVFSDIMLLGTDPLQEVNHMPLHQWLGKNADDEAKKA